MSAPSNCRGVQVAECRSRRRVCQVIGWHIYRLHGGDGAVLCRSNTLLHAAHLGSQRRLVAHGTRHTSQQGAHLRARLRETEDIVYKEQDVARPICTLVAETLSHRQTTQRHTLAGTWGLVHLPEHHRHLTLLHLLRVHF